MIRFGVIGAGRHGERYVRHLANGDAPGATVTAVSRRDATAREALQAAYPVRAHEDDLALIEDEHVDAVIIASPPMQHGPAVRAAVERGKPVLVEKPLTGSWVTSRDLAKHVTDDAAVMVAQTLRFHPVLGAAREQMGRLGTVHRIRIAQRLQPPGIAWQNEPAVAGGGSVVLTGVHLFDLLRWLVGRTPDHVRATIRHVGGTHLENHFDACFGYDDVPLLASTEVSKFTASRSAQLELVGTEGQFDVDYIEGVLRWRRGGIVDTLVEVRDAKTIPLTLMACVEWLRGRAENPVPLRDGVETLRMAEACYRSHDRASTVDLAEIT